MLNPEKIAHEIIQICLPHLSDVAILPWEIQKVIFSIIIHVLQIIYVTSDENKIIATVYCSFSCLFTVV